MIQKKDKSNIFTSTLNQIVLTKSIYQLHKKNGGVLQYTHFRTTLPEKIKEWAVKFDVDDSEIYYYNKKFIKDHMSLYTFKTIDANVYRLNMPLSNEKNNVLVTETKKYGEMLAQDYNSIDVWEEVSTEVANIDSRYNNAIPVWQKSMNTRNYSRENEGFSSNERSSLGNIIGGYGSDFSNFVAMKESLYKKNNI